MKRILKNVVLTLLLLTLSVSTAFLIYLHFFTSDDMELSGEWTAELDLTEQAAVTAFIWLQDIEGVEISLDDVEACMNGNGLTMQVNMILDQNSRTEGTFRCYILPESYENCKQAAYEAFAMAFQDLVAERLHMADYGEYEGDIDRDGVEALVTETFGMSTVSYLMSCGPVLLPSLEELQAGYDGSGTYEIADGILTRRYDTGQPDVTKVDYCVRTDSNLILSERSESDSGTGGFFDDHSTLVYTLIQQQ